MGKDVAAEEDRGPGGRHAPIVFGAAGSAVEWYDFTLYAYLAPIIAAEFFPKEDQLAGLLATYGVFAAGFLMRPLGAFLFGNWGDKVGRRKALSWTVTLMALPMLMVGLLPNYASIGIWAPILLIVARLAQGIFTGGEFSGSVTLLLEHAKAGHRGLTANLAQMTSGAGVLLAALAATIVNSAFNHHDLYSYGWRIPFLLGVGIAGIGLALRLRVAETPAFTKLVETGQVAKRPALEALRTMPRQIVLGVLLIAFGAMAYFLLVTYLPTWLTTSVGAKANEALTMSTVAAGMYVVFTPLAGALSDRIGRRPQLLGAAAATALLAYPMFVLLEEGTLGAIVVAEVVLVGLLIVWVGAVTPAQAELFPTRERYSAMGISYNLSVAIFGGTAPLIATALVHITGSRLAPAYFLIVIAILAVIVVATAFRETARAELA